MTLDDAAIERLVREAKDGDVFAFGRIFDHYHEPIHRYVASRIRHFTDAEDLTQTIFVKALEALPRYEERGIPFGGWLFRLARNAVIDHVRTARQHEELDEHVERATLDTAPDALALRRLDLDAVEIALGALTDEQHEVIRLRFFAGLSAREAAVAMDKQEGTIRGLQFRAIATLRRTLGLHVAEDS